MIPTKLSWLYVATHIHKTFPEEQLHNKQQDNIFTSLAHVAVDIHIIGMSDQIARVRVLLTCCINCILLSQYWFCFRAHEIDGESMKNVKVSYGSKNISKICISAASWARCVDEDEEDVAAPLPRAALCSAMFSPAKWPEPRTEMQTPLAEKIVVTRQKWLHP